MNKSRRVMDFQAKLNLGGKVSAQPKIDQQGLIETQSVQDLKILFDKLRRVYEMTLGPFIPLYPFQRGERVFVKSLIALIRYQQWPWFPVHVVGNFASCELMSALTRMGVFFSLNETHWPLSQK
jgi:hypothetical protein